MDGRLSLGEVSALVNEAEARVRGAVKDRCVMYLEPDVSRSEAPEPEPAARLKRPLGLPCGGTSGGATP